MIYILEGPDGAGKTTLANEIADQKKASVIHSYFDPSWNIKEHHEDMLRAARIVSKWKDVVLDRWAPSEFVYGQVFRGKPGYDVLDYLWMRQPELEGVTWIYCRNDNAVQNHLKNMKEREEMFNDMTEVVKYFDAFVEESDLPWIYYDYNKVDMKEFVKGLGDAR